MEERLKRKLSLLASHLAAAVVGAGIVSAVFSYQLKDAIRGGASLSDLVVSGYYGSLLDMQRETGSDAEYEQALHDYLKVVDKLLTREPKSGVYSTIAFDKTIVLTRLAFLNERRGNAKEAAKFMEAAVTQCETFRRTDCSPEKIRAWAVYLDKRIAERSPAK